MTLLCGRRQIRNCIKWVQSGRLEGSIPKLGPVQIFTFSCTKFLNFINRLLEQSLDSIFCAYTTGKQIEDSTGVWTPIPPLWVHQRVFPCPDNMGSGGQLR